MMTRTRLAGAAALAVLAFACAAQAQTSTPSAPAASAVDPRCAALLGLRSPHVRIDAAMTMKPGDRQPIDAFGLPALPVSTPYCRVSLTLTPVAGSEIHSEVWLPAAEGWNGKFAAMGNAGFGGSLGPPRLSMRPALARGYAVAATDMGHVEPGADGKTAAWALNQPERIIDFGYRANHVTAAAAKTIIAAYYGHAPRLSYFQGCSDGGREALMAAQRYPDDFDGIVAGAPGAAWTRLMTSFAWSWKVAHQNPASRLNAANLNRLQSAALESCDALDGVKDGVIEDPRQCRFDPASILCSRDAAQGCLTPEQLSAVQSLYGGPRRGLTGAALYPGFAPGGEAQRAGWDLWITGDAAQHPDFARSFFANFVFNDADWTLDQFDFDKSFDMARARMAQITDSDNPDMAAFKASGGKLLMYHGWNDPALPAEGTIQYFEKIRDVMGADETDQFARLFMVPGMGHCFGGPGPNAFDSLAILDAWVDDGSAPNRIVASKYANDLAPLLNMPTGPTLSTRPLCAYPAVARWKGEGSTTDETNFTCAASTER
ncbi:Tannase and feruloyl esterase [Brevundimonas sp. SH203]|uniref:tannase/feruloyl esterase family alpha/beta hydrolase n=1 Tax=Brevundimonas sp. SH203 TaxID=345167 RepID=UPI0009CD5348|nr:tannase/feruloyl esterase family alpha/beta hydrolase [Brevundimonas sp. SH203]GAW40949.1 Tannase and feruloyl esterase [Brevundimonas sp. SH203]